MILNFPFRTQRGLTLLEVVIALALFGIMIVAASDVIKTIQVANEGVAAMEDAITLKHLLLNGVSCKETLFAYNPSTGEEDSAKINPACDNLPPNNYLEVISRIPAPLNSDVYGPQYRALIRNFNEKKLDYAAPQFKNIFVRASCVRCNYCYMGRTIKVEYQARAKARNPRDYLLRLSGSSNAQTPWRDLFSGAPFGCLAPGSSKP